MSYFNEKFYTNDFDQEMLDFVEKKYGLSKNQRDVDADFLRYGNSNDYFWTCNGHYSGYRKLTKQQFKHKIGMEENMTTKAFTKADLVAGKHIIELAEGSRYLLVNVIDKVVGFNLQADSKGIQDTWYTYLEENLIYPYNEELTVVAVYEFSEVNVYLQCSDSYLELIWKREEKSETQIQYEKLQQQITELQVQADKLKATL